MRFCGASIGKGGLFKAATIPYFAWAIGASWSSANHEPGGVAYPSQAMTYQFADMQPVSYGARHLMRS
jgi:hypothetical protein